MQKELETLSITDLATVSGGTVQSALQSGASNGYAGLTDGSAKGQKFGSSLLGFGGPVAQTVGGGVGGFVGGLFGGVGGFLGGVGSDIYNTVTK